VVRKGRGLAGDTAHQIQMGAGDRQGEGAPTCRQRWRLTDQAAAP